MFLISSLVTKSIYIFLACFLGIIVLILLAMPIIYASYEKRRYNMAVYHKIYSLAMYNDFYLINNFTLKTDESVIAKIDHLLLSNKFIYVIKDRYYDHAISANRCEEYWYVYDKSGNSERIINPLLLNDIRCDKLAKIKGIERNYIVSIVVVNDRAYIEKDNELNSYNSFICYRKDLKKTIKRIEKRDVNNFKPNELKKQVLELYKDTGREF